MSELARVQFVARRDGIEAGKTFALQTLRVYRRCVLMTGRNNRKKHFASSPEWKRKFINAYLELRQIFHKGIA